jgi:hypothetical protein
MPMWKLQKQIFMTFLERLLGRALSTPKALFIVLFAVLLAVPSFGQMTTRDMDNFKKLDKAKKKRAKRKGPSISSKKRSSAPKKTRQKKSVFSKKHYKLTYIIREEEFLNMWA